MKTNRKRQSARSIVTLSMGVGLMIAQACFATGSVKTISLMPGEEKPTRKSKSSRSLSSRNNASVKIYPDAVRKAMHIVAKGNEGKDIDFFVFDLQGTLMHNCKIKSKGHCKISGLAKGSYVYRVFCGDEETAAGKFEIR